jgi:hypothetical protein
MNYFDKSLVDKFAADYGSTMIFYSYSELFILFKIPSKSRRTFLQKIIQDSCAENIGDTYSKTLSEDYIKYSDNFDFIAVASSEIDINEEIQSKYNKIQGFMIVERGECQTYPDNYCVNLICTKSSVGNILMALYIYIIIQRDDIINKIGLLELANAYYNVGGLCLYTKYGFKFDPHLSNEICYPDFTPNLPMIANIEEYGESKEDKTSRLMSILKTGSGSFEKPRICAIRGNKQKLLGFVLNLQISKYVNMSSRITEKEDKNQFKYIYGIYNKPLTVRDGSIIDYKKLLEIIESEYGGVETFIESGINEINEDQATELIKLVVTPPVEEIKIMVPELLGKRNLGKKISYTSGGKKHTRRTNISRKYNKIKQINRYKKTHRKNKKIKRIQRH